MGKYSEHPDNQWFKKSLDFLKKQHRISHNLAGSQIGLDDHDVKNLRGGRSMVTKKIRKDLIDKFPELNPEKISNKNDLDEIRKEIEELKEENAEMRKTIMEVMREQLRQREKQEV